MNKYLRHKPDSNLNATVAKLHAVYGKRLKPEDYSALISCTSVNEAAGYLKRSTHLAHALEGVDVNTVHRGMLEDVLRKSIIEEYFRIIGFENISGEEFYNYIILKTEIDEILICIQHMIAGSEDHITTLPIYMDKYTCFKLMELAKTRTFSDLLALVAKTPYYSLLKEFAPPSGSASDINYAACELKLRVYYYNRLLSSLEAFDNGARKRLRKSIGVQIDLINIANSYRMIKYFHAEAEYIKPRMLPIYIGIPENRHDELYSSVSAEEFIDKFRRTKYGREMEDCGYDLTDLEKAVQLYRHKEMKRAFSRSQTAPESFFTFNRLMDCEIKNIIRIIEGIRYSLPVGEISALLIT